MKREEYKGSDRKREKANNSNQSLGKSESNVTAADTISVMAPASLSSTGIISEDMQFFKKISENELTKK